MLRPLIRVAGARRVRLSKSTALLVGSAAATTVVLLNNQVHNDAIVDPAGKPSSVPTNTTERVKKTQRQHEENLKVFSWGSDSSDPNSSGNAARLPADAAHLSGFAFRDFISHDKYTAVVDASGDVYIWSEGLNNGARCLTKGKNIQTISASPTRIFALSANGGVYSLEPSSTITLSQPPSSWTSWLWGSGHDRESVVTSVPLKSKEKFTGISAGRDHLLAVTSSGRAFALPITKDANAYGQLGTRKVQITDHSQSGEASQSTPTIELSPKAQIDPYSYSSPFMRSSSSPSSTKPEPVAQDSQLVPCLYEIPSLRGIEISKVAANERSSYALTAHGGRVLAWGANEYGQLGLGASTVIPVVSVPAEVPLYQSYTGNRSVKCIDVAAGGDAAYFVVENTTGSLSGNSSTTVDVLACGMGQYGALGNASYVQAQGTPVKAKVISGNVRYNETTNSSEPIRPLAFSVSPSSSSTTGSGAHALISLSSGNDLLAWGANSSYQLGNGKRSNVAVPTYVRDFALTASGVSEDVDKEVEKQGRMTLRSTAVKELKDLSGKRVGRNVKVEQWPVAGVNSSLVYWRITQ